jgi:hypothetical protein
MKIISCSFLTIFLKYLGLALPSQQVDKLKNVEVIEYTTKHYYHQDSNLVNPFWDFKEKIWFADSFAIEEVRQLNIIEDSKGHNCKSFDIRHYRFSDLKKQLVYEFRYWGDTSTFIRKYNYRDSTLVSGWGFNFPRRLDTLGLMMNMKDTVFGNKTYKRAILSKNLNDIPYNVYCYFDCNRTGTHFDFCPALSNQLGCPLVKFYYSSPKRTGLHMVCEVKLVSNELTVEEQTVFNTFKLFAQNNPVTGK